MNRMLKDVVQMLFIFMVTLVSFGMAMTRLYSYYADMTRLEDSEIEQQPESFNK